MEKKDIYSYYWFGTCERYLQDAAENSLVKGDGGIVENIILFLENLNELGLSTTKRVAKPRLEGILKEVEKQHVLNSKQATNLSEAMREIRITLDAEIQGIYAYVTTPKRLDLQYLLHDVSNLFSPNVYNELPEIARYDFSEAGKCIAFEISTAAAFHIIRATEATLRFYYNRMIKRGRISSNLWGNIIIDLRKKNSTKKHSILNNHLDNIRNSFRNPTQHPEATYDIHEVQDLWAVCVDVVNRMVKIMKTENKL